MKITVLGVGKIKERYWRDAIAEYCKRLSRYCTVTVAELPDQPTPENASKLEEDEIKKKEGARILAYLEKNASGEGVFRVALTIGGRKMDSLAFASWMEKNSLSGKSHAVFVIGGSLGLDPEVVRACDTELSFSDFTFPHQLMRVILLEQIYRSFRIRRGEPYHK